MHIKIVTTINDSFLKAEWERIEQEADIFPQSTYHWCSTWWHFLSGKRKLHIVMVLDNNGKALAIAPLCIERNFGIPVLRSFPIHFGDFYTFINSDNTSSITAIDSILQYLDSNRLWRWVKLEQVCETSLLAKYLIDYKYQKKIMTGCIIADFNGLDWEGYLATLKKQFRKQIRSRLKKINEIFTPELLVINRWHDYENRFFEMVKIHRDRWSDDYAPSKGSVELLCWKNAIKGQFAKCKIVYYELRFNDSPVAYHLGFLHQNTYYAWHTSYDPKYRNYYVGVMILVFMIKHFMNNAISQINFMAGDYDYKLDWSPDQKKVSIYMFSAPPRNLFASVLSWYHLKCRDMLKEYYHNMLKYRSVRVLSRNLLSLRQKISGRG